ncbi:MAG: hypothetical protein ACR2HR_03535 [Euzebya sp.]
MDIATSALGPTRTSVHLTDQAEVAIRLARSLVGGTEGPANVAHLVAGIAGEPEGLAGTILRQRLGEIAPRILGHPAVGARSLPALETAFVALPITDHPAWTLELLHAAVRVGGQDLDYLLSDCGVGLTTSAPYLTPVMPSPAAAEHTAVSPETFGRMSLLDRAFSRDADLAVARTRAAGGDSRSLLAWLGADAATTAALSAAPPVTVDRVVQRASLNDVSVQTTDLITAIMHLSLRAALDRF